MGILVLSDIASEHFDIREGLQLVDIGLLELMAVKPVVGHDLQRPSTHCQSGQNLEFVCSDSTQSELRSFAQPKKRVQGPRTNLVVFNQWAKQA